MFQKTILSTALLAGFAAVSFSAQAADVQLYGTVDYGFVYNVNFSQTGTHDPPKIHKPIGFIFETRLVRTGESFLFDSTKYYQIYDKIK